MWGLMVVRGTSTSMRPTTMETLGILKAKSAIDLKMVWTGRQTMLDGIPRFLSRCRSRATTKAANKPCAVTGTMIAPCMAPLMKRRARGHLQRRSIYG